MKRKKEEQEAREKFIGRRGVNRKIETHDAIKEWLVMSLRTHATSVQRRFRRSINYDFFQDNVNRPTVTSTRLGMIRKCDITSFIFLYLLCLF